MFECEFTEENLAQCLKNNDNVKEWFDVLYEFLPEFGITTTERVSAFIAQCQHESADFTVLQENLNYSADALMKVFKKYFPNRTIALRYHRQKEKIANRVYANRMGNGDEASGDGWKYRGRGIIQITGKSNYERCSNALFGDDSLIKDPDILLMPKYAAASACWYWKENNLNEICDTRDIELLTKRINGGFNGLSDRIKHWEHALSIFGDKNETA